MSRFLKLYFILFYPLLEEGHAQDFGIDQEDSSIYQENMCWRHCYWDCETLSGIDYEECEEAHALCNCLKLRSIRFKVVLVASIVTGLLVSIMLTFLIPFYRKQARNFFRKVWRHPQPQHSF